VPCLKLPNVPTTQKRKAKLVYSKLRTPEFLVSASNCCVVRYFVFHEEYKQDTSIKWLETSCGFHSNQRIYQFSAKIQINCIYFRQDCSSIYSLYNGCWIETQRKIRARKKKRECDTEFARPRFRDSAQKKSFSTTVRNCSGAYPSSCTYNGYWGPFPGVNRRGRGVDDPSPTSA
jgi:hypothetical protein